MSKDNVIEAHRCGDCRSWSRGGLGAGRGGGYCGRWQIPKYKNNTLAAMSCGAFEPKRRG